MVTRESIQGLKQALEKRMSSTLAAHRPVEAGALHADAFYQEISQFTLRPGKRIRPLLYLLALRVLTGEREPLTDGQMDVAAALELLHSFILVHDDVIDASDLRRGQPTLHRRLEAHLPPQVACTNAGTSLAIVAGDLLFAVAQGCIMDAQLDDGLKIRLLRRLVRYISHTGAGEVGDIIFGHEPLASVNLDEIATMYMMKTTRYTVEAPLVLAGVTAQLGERQLAAISLAAEPVGLAFQIENDLQKFTPLLRGVDALPDDLEGCKKTYLLRAAWQLLPARDRQGLEDAVSAAPATSESVATAIRLIQKSGAIGRLEKQVERLFLRGEALLQQSCLEAAHKAGIAQLFRLVRGLTLPVTSGLAQKPVVTPVSRNFTHV